MKNKSYNLEKVRELSDGDDDFVATIVQRFLNEIPVDLELLNKAVQEGNKKSLFGYTQKLIPSIEMFGMDCLVDLRMLQEWSKTTQKVDVSRFHKNFNDQVLKTISQLKVDFVCEPPSLP